MRVELNINEINEAISAGFSAKGIHIKDGTIVFDYGDDGYYLVAVTAEVQSINN